MKLFIGTICCSTRDEEVDTELLVAKDAVQAEIILKERYLDFKESYQWSEVREVNEVDGHLITVSQ